MNLGSVWDKLEPEERKFLHNVIKYLLDKGYYRTQIPKNISYERIVFINLGLMVDILEDYMKINSVIGAKFALIHIEEQKETFKETFIVLIDLLEKLRGTP